MKNEQKKMGQIEKGKNITMGENVDDYDLRKRKREEGEKVEINERGDIFRTLKVSR